MLTSHHSRGTGEDRDAQTGINADALLDFCAVSKTLLHYNKGRTEVLGEHRNLTFLELSATKTVVSQGDEMKDIDLTFPQI